MTQRFIQDDTHASAKTKKTYRHDRCAHVSSPSGLTKYRMTFKTQSNCKVELKSAILVMSTF